MPFESKKQAKYLWANEPEIAREFASKTKDFKKLPEKKAKTQLERIKDA